MASRCVIGATTGCWGSGAATTVATGTAALPRIMMSWNLVTSSSCFVVGNGRSPACLYHVACHFFRLCYCPLSWLFVKRSDCINLVCKRHVCIYFQILSLTLHFFRMPLPFKLVIDHFRTQQLAACSDMKTGYVLFIACNCAKCFFFLLAGKFVQIYSVSSVLTIAVLYDLINKSCSDALAQV